MSEWTWKSIYSIEKTWVCINDAYIFIFKWTSFLKVGCVFFKKWLSLSEKIKLYPGVYQAVCFCLWQLCNVNDRVRCNPGGVASFRGHSAALLLTCLAHLRARWPRSSVDKHTLEHPEGLSRSFSLSHTHTSEQRGWHPCSPLLTLPSCLLAGKLSAALPEEEEQLVSSQQFWHFLVAHGDRKTFFFFLCLMFLIM